MYVDHIETVFHKDLGTWHTQIKDIHAKQGARNTDSFGADTAATTEPVEAANTMATTTMETDGAATETGLTGKPGWVIEMQAHHFHNEDVMNSDCLLYTSPSPRDRQKSRMPSSA